MPMPGFSRLLALGLVLSPVASDAPAVAQAGTIGKPKPVPPEKMPPLPPAVIDNGLAIGGQDMEARQSRSRLTVEVRVNGQGPYHFLVDSGADTSVIGLNIARDLGLATSTPVVLNGMTGSALVGRVIVDELSLGPNRIRNLRLPALKEADVGGQGMIGIDALAQERLLMDFERQLIKVEDASQPVVRLPGEIVVIGRRYRGQLILTEVSAAFLQVEAVIDTGTEISIGNLALRDKLLRKNRDKFFTIRTVGVTGKEVDLQVARVGELRIGSITLRDIPIAFADVPPFKVFGLSDRPALLIGTDLLENFRRISLDFRRRKVRFQLRKCGTTGIALRTDPMIISRLSSGDNRDVCQR